MAKFLIGKYEATIYPEGDGWTGAIDIGYDGTGRRQRIKRKGRTKTIVKDKLITLVADREKGIKTDKDSENYTVRDAVTDWLAHGTKNLDAGTVNGYRILADKHLIPRSARPGSRHSAPTTLTTG